MPKGASRQAFVDQEMTEIAVRNATAADFDAIVVLNASEVEHTSPMDLARLRLLDTLAGYHKVATVDGQVAGFLLAMREGRDYINANFAWFSSRYDSFIYVDRIVVGAQHRDLKLGTLLYRDIFACARRMGARSIACEYNLVPPNEPSRRFHDKFAFRQVGTQWLGDGSKQVSLQLATL
jgi:predicted GNAT superfamily acetyltransferase